MATDAASRLDALAHSSATHAPHAPHADQLPHALSDRLNGDLAGKEIIGWAAYDLDDNNRFAHRFAVLTEDRLILVGETANTSIDLARIETSRVIEGLGVDRISIIADGALIAELRYSRSHRTAMMRLHQKLARLTNKNESANDRPAWLDVVERDAERKMHCPKCGELIPNYAEGVCPQCAAKRKILWRLLAVAKPYRWRVRLALGLTVAWSAVQVLPATISKYLVDDAIQGKGIHHLMNLSRIQALFFLAVLSLATIVLSEFLKSCRLRTLALMGTRVTADMRHQVYSHMHDLSLRYFAKRGVGSLITRITSDTDRLWDFIVFGSIDLVKDIVLIVALACVMFWMNWQLALIALLPLPLLGYLTYKRGRQMQRLFGRLWTYWARLSGVVGDAIPGVRVVKAFANEEKEVRRFDTRNEEYARKEQAIHVIWTGLQPVVSGLMRTGSLLIWVFGGYLVIHHGNADGYTLGTLIAFTAYVNLFYQPIMELANSNRMVTRAATSATRIFEVLDTPPDIYSKADAFIPEKFEGRVEFRNVSFSYEGAQPALRQVSMLAEPGEMIGLCGPSGAGKSTFVNLICRFYDATDGQVLIDGVDVRDYDVKYLRRQIGMVLQEPYLFHGTILENIRYGNSEATEAEIITAARAANAHDFIVGFPDGYDTTVGERGQSLSGGERQRISIARAILHNPKILILDEATSSVDTETERQIQQALDRLVQGRTTFAIAHRLSTLTAADRLVVLESGKIAEQGTHDDLVNKEGGIYAKLHNTQVEMNSFVAIR